MNARPPSWLTLFLPKRRVGRGFSGVEERATRFAWPRAINAHACTHTQVQVHLHPRNSHARSSSGAVWSIRRAYVCMTPGTSSGGPISVDHKGPQPSESLRVNNYYRAPHASPCSRSCSPLVLVLLQACATLAHIHGDPNSVIKRNWSRAALGEDV